jgi:hypothetical protein
MSNAIFGLPEMHKEPILPLAPALMGADPKFPSLKVK